MVGGFPEQVVIAKLGGHDVIGALREYPILSMHTVGIADTPRMEG